MPDEKVKRQHREAKKRVAKILEASGYFLVYPLSGVPDIIGMRKCEYRFIRVVIGKPDERDIKVMKGMNVDHPFFCTKETWAWTGGCFDIREVN